MRQNCFLNSVKLEGTKVNPRHLEHGLTSRTFTADSNANPPSDYPPPNLVPAHAEPGHNPSRVGFMTLPSEQRGKVLIQLVIQGPMPVQAKIQFLALGTDRRPARDIPNREIDRFTKTAVHFSCAPHLSQSPQLACIQHKLGGGPLGYATTEMELPSNSSAVSYCGCRLETQTSAYGKTDYYAERLKHAWGLGKRPKPAYGFMFTAAQHEQLLHEIVGVADRERILQRPYDETATDALVKVYYSLLGGFDTPLLAAASNRQAILQIQRAKTCAGMQLKRQVTSRFGLGSKKRKVVDLPVEIQATEDPLAAVLLKQLLSRDPQWLRIRIRKFTACVTHVAFLEATLIDLVPWPQAARRLRLDRLYAQTVLDRALTLLLFC